MPRQKIRSFPVENEKPETVGKACKIEMGLTGKNKGYNGKLYCHWIKEKNDE